MPRRLPTFIQPALGFGPKPPFVDDWNTIAKISEALRAQILCGMLGVDRITWVSPQAIKIHEIGSLYSKVHSK
jgi:hypothetical protein